MTINISADEFGSLSAHAAAAGYSDVETYVSDFVRALASNPTAGSLLPLSQAELDESLANCDLGMEQIKSGKGLSIDQALERSANQLGDGIQ